MPIIHLLVSEHLYAFGTTMTDPSSVRPLILVVDDERSLFPVYDDLFVSEGWACACLRSPDSAEAIAELNPSLILTDLVFAGDREAGHRFVEALAADPETAAIPIIVCSADVRQLDESRSWIDALACVHLAKPFDIDVLVAAIRQCLQTRAASTNATESAQPRFH
jgi:CheY-like chemotaxis protein